MAAFADITTVSNVSPRLAALLAEPTGYDAPGRSQADLFKMWEGVLRAYKIAESTHQRAEADRSIAFFADDHNYRDRAQESLLRFKQFEEAANRMLETAIPIGSPREMKAAIYWKRCALRRFSISASDNPGWREIVAEDAARLPMPKSRGSNDGTAAKRAGKGK